MLKWINRTIYLKLENELASIYKSIGIDYVVFDDGKETGDRGEARAIETVSNSWGVEKEPIGLCYVLCDSAAFIFVPFEIRYVFKVF